LVGSFSLSPCGRGRSSCLPAFAPSGRFRRLRFPFALSGPGFPAVRPPRLRAAGLADRKMVGFAQSPRLHHPARAPACHLRFSFAALPTVSLISVPPDGCFPAPIAVWMSSVPQNACFPAPPPTGCHGRRLRHAAVVGSVQWPSSRRPLPRDVPDTGTGIPA